MPSLCIRRIHNTGASCFQPCLSRVLIDHSRKLTKTIWFMLSFIAHITKKSLYVLLSNFCFHISFCMNIQSYILLYIQRDMHIYNTTMWQLWDINIMEYRYMEYIYDGTLIQRKKMWMRQIVAVAVDEINWIVKFILFHIPMCLSRSPCSCL